MCARCSVTKISENTFPFNDDSAEFVLVPIDENRKDNSASEPNSTAYPYSLKLSKVF